MSETVVMPNSCPKCGAALPSAATAGLCPRCLMAEAMVPTQADAEPSASGKTLSPAELAPHFSQLEILECLGRGGMGVVYKARQKSLNRLVALKLLAPERVADEKFAQRFTNEAQALAALNHPSIVTIHDFGKAGGFYFLLMEFVDGVNLRQAMKAGRFTPEQALAVVPPVCEALQYAHEHGIVHRDIKPENLLLDKEGRVKIADFGIAKMLGGAATSDSPDQTPAESPVNEGTLASAAGTPQYMAPEQKAHRRTDHRADIYSLGVVLYELLTGELPADKLQPPSRKVQIDVRLDEIVLRALEKTPELRYQTAAELRTQVETMVGTPPPSSSHLAGPTGTKVISPRFLKVGTSTLVTPAYLATARGQFFSYRTRGQLVLDDRQLTHTAPPALVSAVTVIPLAAIRDVSIGKYPRSMNPLGIDLLSVTYEEDGQRKQVLLSPMEGYFALPSTWNVRVAEWATAIREAATAATGRAPTTTPSEKLGVPGSHIALLTMFLMPLVPLGVFVTCLTVLTSPGAARHNTGLMSLFVFGMVALFCLGVFLRRLQLKSPPGSTRVLSPRRIVFGLLAFSAVLLGLAVLAYMIPSKPASGVSNFICIPVGVSNNVVIVDVNAEVAAGGAEVQAALDGPKLSPAIEAELAETFFPPFAGTFVKPTPYVGNRPWRIWSAGPQTWRLGFVLPDATLAKEAFENLRPIGPLPAEPRRTFAGTLFEVGQPGAAEYRASLNVTPPVGSNDRNWVSTSVMTTYNESGVNMNWQVQASQPGTVLLHREGGRSTASLKRDPKTTLHQAAVSLELTKIDTNRVLFVSRIGGVTARVELSGSFRDLSAELLRYKNMSTKTVRGAEIELCQFQGKPVTLQVDALPSTVTTPANVKVVNWSIPFSGIIGLCVIGGVVAVLLLRKGGTARKVVVLLCVLPFLLLAVGLALYMAERAWRATDMEQQARSAAEAMAGLSRSTTPAIQSALAAWQQGDKGRAVSNFIAADWSAGPIFAPESMLSLTESEYLSQTRPVPGFGMTQDVEAKSAQMFKELKMVKELVAAVSQAGREAVAAGRIESARTHFESLQQFGTALDQPNALSILRLEGRAIQKKADGELQNNAAKALAPETATPLHKPQIPVIVRGHLLDQDGKPLGRKPLAFVKDDSVVLTDGSTGDDGAFQFELPVDQPWQVVMLQDGRLSGPRSDLMATPALAITASDAPNYDLELRLEGARLQARLTPLSPPRVLSVDARPDGSSTVTYAVPTKFAVGFSWFRILAVLFLFAILGGGVLVLVLLLRKRGSGAAKVVAVLVGVALLLFLLVVGLIFVYWNISREEGGRAATVERQAALTESQRIERQLATGDFPTGAHIGRNGQSVLVTHDTAELHHVFYYIGYFSSASSGSHNAQTRSWVDEGSVKLKNGRTFGYRRQALYPDELTVNGARHDLRKGRVFVLNDDGTITQRPLSVPLSVARDPVALGQFITEHGGLPASVAGAVWRVHTGRRSAAIDAHLNAGEELLVFIGDESLGWASSSPKAAAVTATVEASSELRLDDGSLGQGFIFRTFGTTTSSTANVEITPGGPVPFGELVFRSDDAVSSKDGIFTFADIHQPDGKLVPVSVRVWTKPPVK